MSGDGSVVFGINPVRALLETPGRHVDALMIMDGQAGRELREVQELARQAGLRYRLVPRRELDRLADGGHHQGVVARVAPRPAPSWDDLLEQMARERDPLLVLLDGVEDPHNLGAILRTAEAFGARAVVTPKDRAAPLSGAAIKAAAGAAERLDVVRVTNLSRALEQLGAAGFTRFGLAGEAALPLDECDYSGPLAVVMGAEGQGLRRLTRERCDHLVAIPMARSGLSLNVSVATGVVLHHIVHSRAGGTGRQG
ncbi:MAG: 23S rRNA (guanosine(2251)-2'-O)-methyltransferase RlmB [Magnetococcus sp. WYHC-3]